MAARKKTTKRSTPRPALSARHGRCGCGGVEFTVKGPVTNVVWCHCSKCRRFHGGPGAYCSIPRGAISFQKRESLAWWDASRTVQRGFCRVCGSSLFFSDSNESTLSLVAGALDTPTGLKGRAHIFVSSKPDWYELEDGLKQHDEV